jgi:hypothetical protein
MDERDRDRQSIDARPEGTGRLRVGVGIAHAGVERAREAGEDAAWFLRERVLWPAEDGLEALGTRGRIGVFGGGGIALAGVVAAILIASSGGSGSGGTTEAFVVPERAPASAAVTPAAKPKQAAKTVGPTLHGAPPDFAAAKNIKAGVGDGKAVGKEAVSGAAGEAPAKRGASGTGTGGEGESDSAAGDSPAASAKIGSTPAATASAEAQASSLANDEASGNVAETGAAGTAGGDESGAAGPPAPKAAKRVARHFAEAFVVYETGGVDTKVRKGFGRTATKQLSKVLLQRPPRQPARVKVPQAKVVNVVASPSTGGVYEVSVSLLRVGVTSELRLQMERGPGKKWQVTNVLG